MKKMLFVVLAIAIIVIAGILLLPKNNNNAQNVTPTPTIADNQNSGVTPSVVDTSTSPKTYNVTIENFAFLPSNLIIKKGETVNWTNLDTAPHQIKETSFEGGVITTGQSYSHTFDSTGSFSYYCNIHTTMKGRIVVE
mgnify:CR=1 FL=1